MSYYALAVGMALAICVVILFRITSLEKNRWAYPILLATFPVYYWVFAVHASDYGALINEITIGSAFLVLACVAVRLKGFIGLLILAFGYIGHAVYDTSHNSLFQNPGTPPWWPEFCGSVDVLIGLYLLFFAVSARKTNAKESSS